jgi:anthranilate phosphoribosyltransferase
MKYFLGKLLVSESLNENEAYEALLKIGNGEINTSQIAAFLMAIQQKGITVEELNGFRNAMLQLAIPLDFQEFDAMDVCGTGGDGKDTFNISTTSAFVVAGAGQKVAKHGNHGVSSAVGSSTVLEHLGVKFTNDQNYLKQKIETANICYLHAPLFHPAMKYVGPIRKELGIKTFFNILGPLLNPAKVKKQLSGVSDLNTFELYVNVFKNTDTKFGIVHALDIYDEISLTGNFILGNRDNTSEYSPKQIGFETCNASELFGGEDLASSGKIMLDILQNNGTKAQTNAVLANAGIALSVANSISIEDGIALAKESLKSAKAFECFKKLVD